MKVNNVQAKQLTKLQCGGQIYRDPSWKMKSLPALSGMEAIKRDIKTGRYYWNASHS